MNGAELSEREREVLGELAWLDKRPDQCRDKDGFNTPLYFGGFNGSHHSHTAKKLWQRGLLERKKLGGPRDKGSCRYRITDAGRTAAQKQRTTP